MANPDSAYSFKFFKRLNGCGTIPTEERYTESNLTIALGDPVYLGTDGYLEIGSASSASLYGFAAMPLTGTAGVRKKLKFFPALEDAVFVGQCSGNYQITRDDVSCDIEGTTGIFEVNEDATSTAVIRLRGLKPGSAYGTNAEVQFTVVKSQYTGQA